MAEEQVVTLALAPAWALSKALSSVAICNEAVLRPHANPVSMRDMQPVTQLAYTSVAVSRLGTWDAHEYSSPWLLLHVIFRRRWTGPMQS